MAWPLIIVVQADGMKTSNRSKAFPDVCWKNLGDAGFPDRILWHKAVAAKCPYCDITRVGIYGNSAGGHGMGGAYGDRKKNDFFVRRLLGVEPPDWNGEEAKRP